MNQSRGPRHLYLVGFMGCGKSTVGALLADRLGLPFVDLDHLIEETAAMTIPQIFQDRGEEGFRKLESRLLAEISRRPPAVNALGGGAFSCQKNRAITRKTGLSIWLQVALPTARQRCLNTARPLARDSGLFETLFHQRQPDFQRSDLHLDTAGKDPGRIVLEILERLRENRYGLDPNH